MALQFAQSVLLKEMNLLKVHLVHVVDLVVIAEQIQTDIKKEVQIQNQKKKKKVKRKVKKILLRRKR